MNETYLEEKVDLLWLHAVHGIPLKGVQCAIIEGNEDCPSIITVYFGLGYTSAYTMYQYDPETDSYVVKERQGESI